MPARVERFAGLFLAGASFVFLACVPGWGRQTDDPIGEPTLKHRCSSIALLSDSPRVPVRLLQPYLSEREDFRQSRLGITENVASADAIVRLVPGQEHTIVVAVENRLTGQFHKFDSDWGDYPGMIALDIMSKLRAVCPGSIAPQPRKNASDNLTNAQKEELRSVRSIAGCSHTSWMDNEDIYHALGTARGLRNTSVTVLPACSDADVTLEIRHNLNLTVQWSWTLKMKQDGNEVNGKVIAFQARDAAHKIVREIGNELLFSARTGCASKREMQASVSSTDKRLRNWRALLMTSVDDPPVTFEIASGKATVRSQSGSQVFAFSLEDIDDVRISRVWDRPIQVGSPLVLVPLFEEMGELGEPMVLLMGPYLPYVIGGTMILGTTINLPTKILEVAWVDDGVERVEAFQMTKGRPDELMRALLVHKSTEDSDPVCDDANRPAQK